LPLLFGQYYVDGGLEPDDCHGQSFEVPETPSGWLYRGRRGHAFHKYRLSVFRRIFGRTPENTHLRPLMYSIIIQDDR
jgi:hypothetical protein